MIFIVGDYSFRSPFTHAGLTADSMRDMAPSLKNL